MNIKKDKKIILGLALTSIVVSIVAIGQYLLKTDSTKNSTNSELVAEIVKRGDVIESISASGQIGTANYLAVTTSANGIVKRVYVTEGTQVKKGDKIMEIILDSEGELSYAEAYAAYLRTRNSVTTAENSLVSLQTTMLQKEDLFEKEKERNSYQSSDERLAFRVAESDYLTAKTNYEAKKSDIAQLKISLSSAWTEHQAQSPIITASADGIIANIVAVEGTKIENSVSERSVKTVASIRQQGTPIASVNVSELDINKIRIGQKVILTLNSISDKTFSGEVAGIDKIGSVSSGVTNYPVIIKLIENSDFILPNMGVEAEIVIAESKNALYVPAAAVKSQGQEYWVVLTANGKTTDKNVRIGISDGVITEILEGLSEGDQINVETLPTSGFTTNSTTNVRTGSFGIFSGAARR